MEQIKKQLMDMGMGKFMDKSRKELGMSDVIYLHDSEDERELEQRYMELDLGKYQRILINDYIACMQTAYHRYADLSYAAGVKDAVEILLRLGFMKEGNEFEKEYHVLSGFITGQILESCSDYESL